MVLPGGSSGQGEIQGTAYVEHYLSPGGLLALPVEVDQHVGQGSSCDRKGPSRAHHLLDNGIHVETSLDAAARDSDGTAGTDNTKVAEKQFSYAPKISVQKQRRERHLVSWRRNLLEQVRMLTQTAARWHADA